MKKDKEQTPHFSLEELQGNAPKTWVVIMATVGLLAIAVGTFMPIMQAHTNPMAAYEHTLQPWMFVYAAGALLFVVAKILSPYTGKSMRIKRLYRIEGWSAVFFCVAAFFIFWDRETTRDVWAFTLAGGAILIFTTLAIPYRIKKELRK